MTHSPHAVDPRPVDPRPLALYPLGLRLSGRAVLVVGGGAVAARRASGLLAVGAIVTVVAPEAGADLRALLATGAVTWRNRRYRTGDLAGAWLAHTATGVTEVDARVAADAEAARIWCVNAGDHTASDAWVPAVTRRDDVTVTVSTGGDPRRAMALRDAIATSLDAGELPLRHHRRTAGTGTVHLVGGGPGDPGLITVLGRRLLAEADVVIADRLGPRSLLGELDPEVLVIDVGKLPGHHPVPQDEINALLVEHARAGRRVVRLKGGDPYVLGRGGEEAAYCRSHGVAVEVVPGVTSAISVPAAAGIPVTHRGVATGFTVVTGHEQLRALPGGRDHTVILLMGVSALSGSAGVLATGTRGEDCPVAIIEDGYGPGQRVTIGTLATIAALAESRGVASPAVVVVGDVVTLSPHARTPRRELVSTAPRKAHS
ncbi:uroporphyrin-III C-methyltransferase/precorrin-2 dehydrogenase/sirohydrochlorin ferrochelatase [Cryobacterium sp. MP_M5]|uniref:uroporphyrinogen-III C-methyltransferase n=1 Tax=unclassified Cryobacterium TaxID=2649013 RepID=UPI0018C94C42|nr:MULTISPECIES: uroporphyrinogen-III C-methyltransferase [unclassified Cryobacterium]MBG6057729.1 uroporphyrin-III C-methyltransferase/precorrin-2 dehydrogenase/sirohydrochlorin ferrochelatase [Cryobacterium sp. MP_M3]MEC5175756.1 uroporphyrin-III C-methyltransferase/precorrin-2 dehydrogenase/sirohydrochlorin ferrochelatase [Cryobacterium sp. MP_M5]